MIKDLTHLKWQKNIYYVSENVIFDITTKKKNPDLDACGTYLINLEKAPQNIKNAKDGANLDLSKCVDVFTENVPYIKLVFISPNGNELNKIFPLQYLIEKGDMIVDGKTLQQHPDVFDNKYVNKFNQEVFDFIKNLVKNKADFDPKNVDLVMNGLPDWLTMDIEFKYMTEEYIDKNFLKGLHYNSKIATKNAKSDNDVYQFRSAYLGIGLDPLEGVYSPINIWQKENVQKFLNAIYAERTIAKYNDCVKTELNALSVDSMEKIAESLKTAELGFNKKNIKTFLNTEYRDHDCDGVNFESVCANEDIDTWYEYLKRKDEAPILNVEEITAEDKAFVDQYIQDNFENPSEVNKYWWETNITMDKYYNDEDAANNKPESVINVFTVATETYAIVLMIYHEGDSRMVAEHKNAVWVGDNDLYQREEQMVKTFDEAYQAMINSQFDKPESRQCTLRAQLGPQGATTPPQFIFGNIHYQLYVNAQTGEVLNYSPAYPPEESDKLNGTAEDIRERHQQLINNRYGLNSWCQSNGAFMDFMDSSEFDVNELYEVNDFFKVEESGLSLIVNETAEEQYTEEVEGDYEPMPNGTIVTLVEAATAVLDVNKAPHSEHWYLINDNGTPKYKFGSDVFVNAITGEVIEQ